MGNACARTAIDVIPDKEVMLEIVDSITTFETMLKKGQELTKAQEKERAKCASVAKAMKKLQKHKAARGTLSVE
jgi:hypothetical protein